MFLTLLFSQHATKHLAAAENYFLIPRLHPSRRLTLHKHEILATNLEPLRLRTVSFYAGRILRRVVVKFQPRFSAG